MPCKRRKNTVAWLGHWKKKPISPPTWTCLPTASKAWTYRHRASRWRHWQLRSSSRLERPTDALEQAQAHIANGRFNQAVALLEEAIKEEPQRSDLRLALMEVHAQQGDRAAFTAQERKLIATGKNHAEVEQLKSRYPTMLVAAADLSAAAVAAELDAKYVETLLADEPPAPVQPEPKPELKPQPVVAEVPESIPVLTPEPELQKPVTEQPAPEPR